MSASGIVFDSSIYISALRQGDASIFSSRRARLQGEDKDRSLWLSVVVLEELYVGARGQKMKKLLSRFEHEFAGMGRLVVPMQSDWTASGQVLALIGEKYGYELVGQARLTNDDDALIGINAARLGHTILTRNATDFQKIAEFRPLRWEEV